MNPVERIVAWWRGVNPWWKDGLLTAALVAGCTIALVAEWTPTDPDVRRPDALAVGLTLAANVPILVRRIRPLLVLYTVGLAAALQLVLDYPDTTGGFSVIIGVYTVASRCDRRQSGVAAAFVAAILCAIWSSSPAGADEADVSTVVSNFVLFGTAWILGDYVRIRRLRQAELEERARRLEQERDDEARRAVAEERARIARELHDVVAHSMSVMTVQAGAARRVVEHDPAQAREALVAIETTGREALVEMRRLLGVLRDQSHDDSLAPVPGLDRVGLLVQQVRDAGLAVDLHEEAGDGAPLPQGVDVSAYRIVQEALTNALKHAGPARVRVVVRRLDGAVDIEVVDDGRGLAASPDGDRGGHGLVGMRERVALYGGTLEAGPRRGGGFRVHAWLPAAAPAGHLVGGAP